MKPKSIVKKDSDSKLVYEAIRKDPVGKVKSMKAVGNPGDVVRAVVKESSADDLFFDEFCKEAKVPLQYNKLYATLGGAAGGLAAYQAKRNDGAGVGESLAWAIPAGFVSHAVGNHISKTMALNAAKSTGKHFVNEMETNINHLKEQTSKPLTDNEMADYFLKNEKNKIHSDSVIDKYEGGKAHVVNATGKYNGKSSLDIAQQHYSEPFNEHMTGYNDSINKMKGELSEKEIIKNNLDKFKDKGVNLENFVGHVHNRHGGELSEVNKIFGDADFDKVMDHPFVQSALKEHVNEGKGSFGKLFTPKKISLDHL